MFPLLKYELRENVSVWFTAGYPMPKIVSGIMQVLSKYLLNEYQTMTSLDMIAWGWVKLLWFSVLVFK